MVNRLLLLALSFFLLCQVKAQEIEDTISMSFEDLPLEIILDSISYKSGYFFSYNADIMPTGSLFSLTRENVHVRDLLNTLFVGTNLEHSFRDDQIILKAQNPQREPAKDTRFSTISGWVRDHKTKEPIVGTHVFINGSTIGTTTDANGNYKLYEVPPGNYIFVFSHVGYDLASYELVANTPAHHKVNAALTQSAKVLEALEISSLPLVDEIDWSYYYKKFSEQFIGNAPNSNRCTFVNPEVLEFAHSDSLDTYEAMASEPLIMNNEGLGYKVVFNIDSYTSSTQEIRFHVTARFENLDPPNRRTKRRWKKNREKSYNGSRFHFFKALMNDELKSEGFDVYHINSLEELDNLSSPIQAEDVLLSSEKRYKYLNFDGYLMVIYKNELQSPSYQQDMSASAQLQSFSGAVSRIGLVETQHQKSLLKLDTTQLKILSNGQIVEPEDLSAYGYWSWERMSELMPIDYDPKSDEFK